MSGSNAEKCDLTRDRRSTFKSIANKCNTFKIMGTNILQILQKNQNRVYCDTAIC